MSRHRRGEIQILTDILSLALTSAKATQLMYKANLSYSTLQKYLSISLKQGLIIKNCGDDGSVTYQTTVKGKLLLTQLKEIACILYS